MVDEASIAIITIVAINSINVKPEELLRNKKRRLKPAFLDLLHTINIFITYSPYYQCKSHTDAASLTSSPPQWNKLSTTGSVPPVSCAMRSELSLCKAK